MHSSEREQLARQHLAAKGTSGQVVERGRWKERALGRLSLEGNAGRGSGGGVAGGEAASCAATGAERTFLLGQGQQAVHWVPAQD